MLGLNEQAVTARYDAVPHGLIHTAIVGYRDLNGATMVKYAEHSARRKIDLC